MVTQWTPSCHQGIIVIIVESQGLLLNMKLHKYATGARQNNNLCFLVSTLTAVYFLPLLNCVRVYAFELKARLKELKDKRRNLDLNQPKFELHVCPLLPFKIFWAFLSPKLI